MARSRKPPTRPTPKDEALTLTPSVDTPKALSVAAKRRASRRATPVAKAKPRKTAKVAKPKASPKAPSATAAAKAGTGAAGEASTPLTVDAADAALPLEYMLTVMRDPATPEARRAEMAKAAAPYLHTKAVKAEQSDPHAQSPDADAGDARKTLQRKLARLAARSGTAKLSGKPD